MVWSAWPHCCRCGGDESETSCATVRMLVEGDPVDVAWNLDTGADGGGIVRGVEIVGEHFYVSGEIAALRYLRKYDLETRTLQAEDSWSATRLATDGEYLYALSSGEPLKFRKYDLDLAVVHEVDTAADGNPFDLRGITVTGGGVYVITSGGTLMKYDSDGLLQWTRSAGIAGYDVTPGGPGVVVAAHLPATPFFIPVLFWDIVAFTPDGTRVWSWEFPGARRVKVDSAGNIYAARSMLFGQTVGLVKMSNATPPTSVWQANSHIGSLSAIAVDADDCPILCGGLVVNRFSAADGALLWSFNHGGSVQDVRAGGSVLMGGDRVCGA